MQGFRRVAASLPWIDVAGNGDKRKADEQGAGSAQPLTTAQQEAQLAAQIVADEVLEQQGKENEEKAEQLLKAWRSDLTKTAKRLQVARQKLFHLRLGGYPFPVTPENLIDPRYAYDYFSEKDKARYAKLVDTLTEKYMPREGRSGNAAVELLRTTVNFNYELYNNGLGGNEGRYIDLLRNDNLKDIQEYLPKGVLGRFVEILRYYRDIGFTVPYGLPDDYDLSQELLDMKREKGESETHNFAEKLAWELYPSILSAVVCYVYNHKELGDASAATTWRNLRAQQQRNELVPAESERLARLEQSDSLRDTVGGILRLDAEMRTLEQGAGKARQHAANRRSQITRLERKMDDEQNVFVIFAADVKERTLRDAAAVCIVAPSQ